MATAKEKKAEKEKKAADAKKAEPKKRIESPTSLTFVDDKRAQYARLVALNHGKKSKLVPTKTDVSSITKAQLEKCLKSLTGGNLLEGSGGIEYIREMSKAGALHPDVAKRGLTTAYAQEVRPFLRRWNVSEDFGRRGKKAEPKEKKEEKEEESEEETEEGTEEEAA